MRQRGDKDYTDLLSAVRVGTIGDCQLEMLQQQLIATGRRATVSKIVVKYHELSDIGPIVLMPAEAMFAEVNTAMLATLGEDNHTLLTDDKPETIVSKKKLLRKVQEAFEKVSEDSTRTAGLEKTVEFSHLDTPVNIERVSFSFEVLKYVHFTH